MAAPVCTRSVSQEAAFWRSRAEFWEAEATRLAAENATLAGTVEAQRQQVEGLRQRVVTLSRMWSGTSSEKDPPAGGMRGPVMAAPVVALPAGEAIAAVSCRGRRGMAGACMSIWRPRSRSTTSRRVSGAARDAAGPDEPFGEDVSEQVSWRVRVWRRAHRRRKYARCCRCPVPAVRTAPGPAKLIDRGLFTTEFCVNLLIAKYALGLPFNRVIAMLAFQGLEVVRARWPGWPGGWTGCWRRWRPRSRRGTPPPGTPTRTRRPGGCSGSPPTAGEAAGGCGCSPARTRWCTRSRRHGR